VVRVRDGKALARPPTARRAIASPISCQAQAVAELAQPHRGRRPPVALTDNMNFESGERPESWASSSAASKACAKRTALGYPVVSGNISLYNETNGAGIWPTPTHRRRRLLDGGRRPSASLFWRPASQTVVLIGDTKKGASRRLALLSGDRGARRGGAAAGRSRRRAARIRR
jgi:phosphoribosylformylglycinamidine synthase